MSKVTSHAPGTPCWVEIAVPDIEAAAAFYGDLLGWEVPEQPSSAEMGGYRRAQFKGDDVAGMMPLMQEGQPSAWLVHFAVDDLDAAVARVKENGGTVVTEPMDVMGMLRFAVFADPTGAVFGLTEPGTFIGAERMNGPGAICWTELGTRDPEGAKKFYGAVFGWDADEHELQRADGGPGPAVYVEWQQGGESIGGMMDISGMLPAEVPAHWLVYFGVENADEAVDKVKAAGGEVRFGPVDIDAGRFAVVTQPGAEPGVFAVIQPAD